MAFRGPFGGEIGVHSPSRRTGANRLRVRSNTVARRRNSGRSPGVERRMKVRNSLRTLKNKPGSVVTRRRGRVVVINRRNPRWTARQG
jgi:large subunit ribosomal protein L36